MHLCGPQIDRVGLCWAVQRRDEMATSSCLRRMKWRYHSTKSTKLFLCSFHVLLPPPSSHVLATTIVFKFTYSKLNFGGVAPPPPPTFKEQVKKIKVIL